MTFLTQVMFVIYGDSRGDTVTLSGYILDCRALLLTVTLLKLRWPVHTNLDTSYASFAVNHFKKHDCVFLPSKRKTIILIVQQTYVLMY